MPTFRRALWALGLFALGFITLVSICLAHLFISLRARHEVLVDQEGAAAYVLPLLGYAALFLCSYALLY